MSLKAFHVFFVIVSTLLTIGFGVWCVRVYLHEGNAGTLIMGVASFALSLVLMIYFRWFLKKLKNVGYL